MTLELGIALIGVLLACWQVHLQSRSLQKKSDGDTPRITLSKKIYSLAISGLASLSKKISDGPNVASRPLKKNPPNQVVLDAAMAFKKNAQMQVKLACDGPGYKKSRSVHGSRTEKKKPSLSGIPLEQKKALENRLAYWAIQKNAAVNSAANETFKKKPSLSTLVDSEQRKSVFPTPVAIQTGFLKKAPEIAICY